MIVYGDRHRLLSVERGCEEVRAMLRTGDPQESLIAAGELAQALTDWEFDALGSVDDISPIRTACTALLRECAEWMVGGQQSSDGVEKRLRCLELLSLPSGRLTFKLCEGYSYYALTPELYRRSAMRLRKRLPESFDWRVIGIRSIGTSLGAIVSASLRVQQAVPTWTLRPVGHPFSRRVNIGPGLEREILRDREQAMYVIVDEGPGLSGSSFGSVADWLESHGVGSEQIAFISGHSGELGPHASGRHRRRWSRSVREATSPESRMQEMFGPDAEFVGAGRWRGIHFKGEDACPVHLRQEKMKCRYRGTDGRWLHAKYIGLGWLGRLKLKKAVELASAGFVPRPLDFKSGYLIEEWVEDGRPMPPGRKQLEFRVSEYLKHRASAQPLSSELRTTSARDLLEMAVHNTSAALGPQVADLLMSWESRLDQIESRRRVAYTDGRMHAWEWLDSRSGGILKTDAIDHAFAHDCVGPQDIHWDLAGAEIELGLGIRPAGFDFDPELLEFHRLAYLAFQGGYYAQSAIENASDPQERLRCERRSRWYFDRLYAARVRFPSAA